MADAPRALAVVELSGPALRYAELVPGDGGVRLRRLGACDFDADVEAALFAPEPADGAPDAVSQGLSVAARAVRQMFDGVDARALVAVVHPPAATSFFAPLPADLDAAARHAQLRQEAAMLADLPAEESVRIRAVPVREAQLDGRPHVWHHVLHVGPAVHGRLARLAQAIGARTYDIVDATRSAAAVVRALTADDADGVSVAVGVYADHTEVAVVEDGVWTFGHHGPGQTPEDTAYYALAALQRVGVAPGGVRRLFTYGDWVAGDRTSMLAPLLGVDPTPLDPMSLFSRRPGGASPEQLAAYAPVLGAAA